MQVERFSRNHLRIGALSDGRGSPVGPRHLCCPPTVLYHPPKAYWFQTRYEERCVHRFWTLRR